ncbi:hypothetical protein AB0K24_52045 [Streptomyces mirabilis]|uniref:hypothetical protein n=1 Tax=Streptomyces mirabilis TaxID=68239 RepID=UPI0034138931
MHRDGFFHRRHLLAKARRHLALVLRGRHRHPGLDERIVDAALAVQCTDITEPRTERGHSPEYRHYTRIGARPGPLPARRRPTAAPDHDADRRPPADQAAPHLPLDAGEWPLPRDPLRHDRAVIASAVLSARLRTGRRAGRDPYDVFAHQQAAMPEELLLLDQAEQPTQKKADPVDIAALRTDLERLELTADQLFQLARAGKAVAGLADDVRDRMRTDLHHGDGAAPRPYREDDQCAHQPHQPAPGRSPGAHP